MPLPLLPLIAGTASRVAAGQVVRQGAKYTAKRMAKRAAVRTRRFLRKYGDDILEAGANAGLAGLAAAFGGTYTPKDKEDAAAAAGGGRARGAAGAVADLPTLGSPKKAEKVSAPTVDTIRGQIADLLKVSISLKDISSKHHKLLVDQHAQAVRVSREGTQERRGPAGAVDATPEPTQGGDLMSATDLETDFQDLHQAIQDVIDRLNGISSGGGGGGGVDIDLPSNRSKGPKGKGALRRLLGRGANLLRGGMQGLANFGGTSVGVATAGMAAAIATTGAGLYAIDKFMKSTYSDANKPLAELERRYGMKAIKNSSGFTTHFEIKGKKYRSDNLPPDYQTLLDAYGPTADPRTPATKNALNYIQKNREHFKSLEKETQTRQIQAGIQPAKPGQISSSAGGSLGGGVMGGGGAQAVSATPPPSATRTSTGAAANVGGGGGGGTKPAQQKPKDASAAPVASPPTAAAAIQEAAMAPPINEQDMGMFNINTPQGMQSVRQQQVRTGFVGTGNVPDPTYYNVGSLPASIMFYMPHVKPDGTHPTLNEARF